MTTSTANQLNTKSIPANADFDHIIVELNDKETVLKAKQDDLVKALDKASKQLENVRSAIIALSGQSSTKPLNDTTKQRKQTVDEKTVLKLVCDVLKDRGPLPLPDLVQQVESVVVNRNLSKLGVPSKIAKAVRSSAFSIDSNQIVALVKR